MSEIEEYEAAEWGLMQALGVDDPQRIHPAIEQLKHEREETLQEVGRLRARVEELEALPDPVLTFGEADDRRGFVLFIDGEQVGEPVTYDDFGWAGIDLAKALVLAVAKAFGSEVSGRG